MRKVKLDKLKELSEKLEPFDDKQSLTPEEQEEMNKLEAEYQQVLRSK